MKEKTINIYLHIIYMIRIFFGFGPGFGFQVGFETKSLISKFKSKFFLIWKMNQNSNLIKSNRIKINQKVVKLNFSVIPRNHNPLKFYTLRISKSFATRAEWPWFMMGSKLIQSLEREIWWELRPTSTMWSKFGSSSDPNLDPLYSFGSVVSS